MLVYLQLITTMQELDFHNRVRELLRLLSKDSLDSMSLKNSTMQDSVLMLASQLKLLCIRGEVKLPNQCLLMLQNQIHTLIDLLNIHQAHLVLEQILKLISESMLMETFLSLVFLKKEPHIKLVID